MIPQKLRFWPIFDRLKPEMLLNIHMVFVYGKGTSALIVTHDKMVYGLGNNESGCLGIGTSSDTWVPQEVKELCNKNIKTIACNDQLQVVAVTEEGEMYSWGHVSGTSNEQLTPIILKFDWIRRPIVDIACGSSFFLALTSDGEVYVWGEMNCQQIIPNSSTLLRNLNVVCISCTYSSIVLVTNNGEVYTNKNQQVGRSNVPLNAFNISLRKLERPDDIFIEKIACGYSHTLALSNLGGLYVWGSNTYEELGLNTSNFGCPPTELKLKEMGQVLDIAASYKSNISIAMGVCRKVFIWGRCQGTAFKSPFLTPLTCLHDAFALYSSPRVMHQPLIFDDRQESGLLVHLRKAFDDSTSSDLTVKVEGRSIFVHKSVLKIRCQYFRAMFHGVWAENNQNVLEHDQFSHDVYKAFLKYLYTDEVDLSVKDVVELAHTYCENRLKRVCIEIMKNNISAENVSILYTEAVKYNAKEFEEYCLNFTLKHMTKAILSPHFFELNRSLMKTVLIRAAEAGVFKT
ncbi:RCC1 and BTB domain-containing protein 1-like isoform X2 [Calliopsis andreniformis]|uniref:RCC1 and BTB domain-containing protein 1-like isoform X2 n=1 Tax=Calliopsis andreniformis TaxID=337506 RepID=UPI003FCC4FCE